MLPPLQFQGTVTKVVGMVKPSLIALCSLGEGPLPEKVLEIASQKVMPVVCAGNSSWHGRNVQLEVPETCSWILL